MASQSKVAFALLALFLFNSPLVSGAVRPSPKEFTIMAYNAENLFDTLHDEGKNDYAYMPKKVKDKDPVVQQYCRALRSRFYRERCFNMDWNMDVLTKKIKNLAKVIKRANFGKGPDILVLEEVENKNVLKLLRDIGLPKSGYQEMVLIEGPGSRGIDMAILSRFPLAERAKLHPLEAQDSRTGKQKLLRSFLEATFEIHGMNVTVLANHWMAQSAPAELRYKSAKLMAEVASQSDYPVVATGDFNVVDGDDPHAFREVILNENRRYSFWDSEKVHFGDQPKKVSVHRGTHHYNGVWNSLDRMFILKGSLANGCKTWWRECLVPKFDSFQIIKENFMLHDYKYTDEISGEVVTYKNVPMPFNFKTGEGFSDHLPIIMRFEVNQ